MIDTPTIVRTKAQQTAIVRVTVPRTEIQKAMGPAHQELMAAVKTQRVATSGPWFTHHLRMNPGIFDFEVSVPVSAPISPVGRVQPGTLPAARVARTVYHGNYDGLGAAWGELDAWVDAQGHQRAADLWEVYVAGPESGSDPAKWRTELNRPLID